MTKLSIEFLKNSTTWHNSCLRSESLVLADTVVHFIFNGLLQCMVKKEYNSYYGQRGNITEMPPVSAKLPS
jgi:hypothetical protein